MLQSILDAMDRSGQRLPDVEANTVGDLQRVTFPLSATNRQHETLNAELSGRPGIEKLFTFRDPEDD
jgi:hypothetical protein